MLSEERIEYYDDKLCTGNMRPRYAIKEISTETAQEIIKLIEEEAALHVGNVQNNGKRDSGVYEQGIGMEKIVMLIKAKMQG